MLHGKPMLKRPCSALTSAQLERVLSKITTQRTRPYRPRTELGDLEESRQSLMSLISISRRVPEHLWKEIGVKLKEALVETVTVSPGKYFSICLIKQYKIKATRLL